MMTNNSKQQQSRSRSFREAVVVYWKLVRFYFYNLLRNGNYLLISLYFVTPLVPLLLAPFLLTPGARKAYHETKSKIENIQNEVSSSTNLLSPFVLNEIPERISNEVPARLQWLVLVRSLMEDEALPWALHIFFFFNIGSAVVQNLYLLGRRNVNNATPQEEDIISSVEKIRPYDIFFFEATFLLLVQLLHLVLVISTCSLYRRLSAENLRSLSKYDLVLYIQKFSVSWISSIICGILISFKTLSIKRFLKESLKLSTSDRQVEIFSRVMLTFAGLQGCYFNYRKTKALRS